MSQQQIVLGIGASISAYKGIEVLRLLTKEGFDVQVIPTPDSLHFVGQDTWKALSGHDAPVSVFELATGVGHVQLAGRAAAVAIVGASADLLAKFAHGLASDLLGVTVLAATAPTIIAPAMHPSMWENPATVANVTCLQTRGFRFVGPENGDLADGNRGIGRLSEPKEIVDAILCSLDSANSSDSVLNGQRVLVSAGGTREDIDPVRFITNRSSGRQGCAIAAAALAAGAKVDLVSANVDKELIPPGATVHPVRDAAQLHQRMLELQPVANQIYQVAAVADFTPKTKHGRKLARANLDSYVLELERTPDVLADLVSNRLNNQVIIGFAAQTGEISDVLEQGSRKAATKGCDFTAVNQVGEQIGFDVSDNRIFLYDKRGNQVAQFNGSKVCLARELVAWITAQIPS